MIALDLLAVALVLGLASSLHCLAMCGGITAAIANAAPLRMRQDPIRLGAHLLLVNGGRIGSYAVAGAIAGALGAGAVAGFVGPDAQVALRYLAAGFLIAIGFTIAGWLPLTDKFGTWAVPLWTRIRKTVQRLAPGAGPGSVAYGLIWGWLPCGMVYTTLFYAVIAGSAPAGAMVMVAFGLGTVPALLALGLATGRIQLLPEHSFYARQAMGSLMVLLALGSVALGGPDGPFCLSSAPSN